jgi:serine/threonine protein phosphatase PrpC
MPMSVPTQAMPRVAPEPRMPLPQSMQPTQPNLCQGVGRTGALTTPSSALAPMIMREQLRIVPRIIDDVSDTIPIVPPASDIAVRDTLPDTDLVEVDDANDDADDEDGDGEEEMLLAESQDTLTDVEVYTPGSDPLRLLVGIGLDTGIARKDVPNEDNLFAIQGMRPTGAGPEPVGLFIVADGMGGHAHGQEASKLAVHAISDAIVPTLMRQVDNDEVFSDLLKDGVHRANLAIYRRNREQEHMMGTTLTALLVVASTAYVVNVGDSRTYLYRAGQGLQQITRDHSIVARLMEDGAISREDIYTHPKRNQIYRCLGERASVEVDTFVRTLQADDVLVLCSDGLWEMVHDDEMENSIASSHAYPSQLSKMLIQAALMRGGADNISVIVACMSQTDTI